MLGDKPTTVKEYLNEYLKKGRITQRQLETHFESIRAAVATDVGKNLLISDIERFEELLFKLIDNGFGQDLNQANDDELVEMRYLKNRILRVSKQVNQYVALTGQGE